MLYCLLKNRSKFVAGDSNKFIAGPSQIVFALNPPYWQVEVNNAWFSSYFLKYFAFMFLLENFVKQYELTLYNWREKHRRTAGDPWVQKNRKLFTN